MSNPSLVAAATGHVAAGEGMCLRSGRVALVSLPGGDPQISGRLVELVQAENDPVGVHAALTDVVTRFGRDGRPNCVVVVEDDQGGLLLSLIGRTQAIGTIGGQPIELRGNDHHGWVDVRLPVGVESLSVGAIETVAEAAVGAELADGLALGTALHLSRDADDRSGADRADGEGASSPDTDPPVRPEPQAEAEQGPDAEATAGSRAPIEQAPPSPAADAPLVTGLLCENGHFNHPGARYCRIDGVSLQDAGADPVERARPPLGVFVMTDGTTVTIDGDLVIGRSPHDDPACASGARPVTIADPTVAAVHADVHLEGWDVVITDREDRYTTWIWPLTGDPRPLRARESVTLTGGDRIAFGHRELLFESHHR